MPDGALLVAILFNGLALGMVYLLFAVGLTVIFGMLDVVNFAHGVFYAAGAYLAYAVVSGLESFGLALVMVPALVAVIGAMLEMGLVRRLYGRGHIAQILLTYGLVFVFQELFIISWGPVGKTIAVPTFLSGMVDLGFMMYPRLRVFIIVVAALVTVAAWLLLVRTRYGAIIRAGIEDSDMVSCLGINVGRVFTWTFALGTALAGMAGVLALPIRGAQPSMGADILGLSFVVVVLGGLGSFAGATVGALLIGLVQSGMALLWPAGTNVAIFSFMALVLLVRPQGLVGLR